MRRTIDMGGSWEFYPLYGTVCDISLPDELPEAESITVPSGWKAPGIALRDFDPGDIYGYPERWNDADTGVLRRRVHISAEPGERVFLNAEGVAQRCALYVGARHICDHDEMFLPLHADITDGIANGEAEITFVCTSFESTTLTSGSVKTTGLTGSWFGSNLRGIWGDISLEILPQSHISDLAIRCSVRHGEISVLPELSDAPDGARMHYEVLDGERAVLSFDGGCGRQSADGRMPSTGTRTIRSCIGCAPSLSAAARSSTAAPSDSAFARYGRRGQNSSSTASR